MRDPVGRILTDDLQIHLLQLTNLRFTRENLASAPAVHRWAFFLLNAGTLEQDDLRKLFPEPAFVEAMEVLDVINKTPEQRDEYISRLKSQLDEAARLEYAHEEGFRAGELKGELRGELRGELIGRIVVYQELLSLAQPDRDELSTYDIARLTALADQLQHQLRSR